MCQPSRPCLINGTWFAGRSELSSPKRPPRWPSVGNWWLTCPSGPLRKRPNTVWKVSRLKKTSSASSWTWTRSRCLRTARKQRCCGCWRLPTSPTSRVSTGSTTTRCRPTPWWGREATPRCYGSKAPRRPSRWPSTATGVSADWTPTREA